MVLTGQLGSPSNWAPNLAAQPMAEERTPSATPTKDSDPFRTQRETFLSNCNLIQLNEAITFLREITKNRFVITGSSAILLWDTYTRQKGFDLGEPFRPVGDIDVLVPADVERSLSPAQQRSFANYREDKPLIKLWAVKDTASDEVRPENPTKRLLPQFKRQAGDRIKIDLIIQGEQRFGSLQSVDSILLNEIGLPLVTLGQLIESLDARSKDPEESSAKKAEIQTDLVHLEMIKNFLQPEPTDNQRPAHRDLSGFTTARGAIDGGQETTGAPTNKLNSVKRRLPF